MYPSLLCVFSIGAYGERLRKDKKICPIYKLAKKTPANDPIQGRTTIKHFLLLLGASYK